MPTVLAASAQRKVTPRIRLVRAAFVAVVVVVVALATERTTRMPSVVEQIEVVNPNSWHANVDVSSGTGGRLALGTAERESAARIEAVIDQGETWVFHFSYAGLDGGAVAVSRNALDAANWRVTVPEQFAARMRAAAIDPSAQ